MSGIETTERFLFLKIMNRLYSISFLENAVQTQEYVTKIISFFRYYTGEEKKVVRMKEEMSVVVLFAEILAISTGNSLHISFNPEDGESSDLYIPARSLLFFVRDIFIREDVKDGKLTVQASSEEDGIAVLMLLHSEGMVNNSLASGIKELEKRFESFYGSEIIISLKERDNALWEIFFKLPKEK